MAPRRRSGTAKRTTSPDDGAAVRIAAGQNDIITARQLAGCGIDSDAITVRVGRHQLHRRHQGIYAVGTGVLTLKGELTAAALACGANATLGSRAAAAWWGQLAWERGAVDVIVRGNAGRKKAGIRPRYTRVDERDVWHRDGIRITSPARTLLDLAADLPPDKLRRAVRQATAERRVHVRELQDILARTPRHRGARALKAIVEQGHAPTRSAMEDLALDLIVSDGIQRPEINARLVIDRRRIEPDLLWRQQRVIVELDGAAWHDNPVARQHDAERQALLEVHGYRVLRITWHQLTHEPQQTLARIRAALSYGEKNGVET